MKGKDARYQVRLSQDPDFPESKTITAKELRWAMFNPHTELPAGRWHWRYLVYSDATLQHKSQVYSFTVPASARISVTPAADKMLAACRRSHPRILITADELDAFRKRVKSSGQAKPIIAAANRYTSREPPTEESGRPEHRGKNSYENASFTKWASKALGNQVSAAVGSLTRAYIITGDKKFGRAALRYAVRVAQWDPDGVTNYKVSDFADGACLRAMALAYDSCYDLLSQSEKLQLQSAIATRAGRMFSRWHNNLETRVFSAHIWQHILHEFTEAAFATLGDIADAELWAGYVYELWLARVPLLGGDDGGWANGNNYFGTNFVTLISMPTFFERLTGVDFFSHLWYRNTIYYMIYTWPPYSSPDGFGDGGEARSQTPLSRLAFADVLARKFNDPYGTWYVNKSLEATRTTIENDASLRWHRLHSGYDNARTFSEVSFDLPQARLFGDIGVVTMHTDLANTANNLMLAFRSSPYGSFNHAHADQNAFAIMKGGTALAIPSGYYGPSYGKPHHAQWTRATKANNCILVDGQGQKIRSAAAVGAIIDFKDTAGYSYVAGDATPAYMGRLNKWVRRILFLRPGLFLLLDEIEAPKPSQYQWLMHAFEKMEIHGNRVTSHRRGATLNVTLACSLGLNFEQTDQFDTPYNYGIPKAYHLEKANHWHVTAETAKTSKKTRIAAVMAVYDANEKFNVQLQHEKGWLGATAAGDFGQVVGWIRIDESAARPTSLTSEIIDRQIDLWGRSRDGEVIYV